MNDLVSPAGLAALGLADAEAFCRRLESLLPLAPAERWRRVSQELLGPELPAGLLGHLYDRLYRGWDRAQGPPPAWLPGPAELTESNPARMMRDKGFATFAELHAWSVRDRAGFWDDLVRRLGIRLRAPYSSILDPAGGPERPRWLVGAELNLAESCFAGDPAAPAVVFAGEDGRAGSLSLGELEELADRVARGLADRGVRPGDVAAVDLPMTVEAVAVYLGIVKAGGAVASIADSFAAEEIAARLRISGAKLIFTGDVIPRGGKALPLYEKVRAAGAPPAVILPAGERLAAALRPGDLPWASFLGRAGRFEAVPRRPDDLLNVLFSSGTTAEPKAIPWTQTTPIKCAADGFLHQDIRPGHVVAWPTNLGWMMGPWLIFATLVNRGTIALYQGAPTTRGFCEFVRDARVNMLGVIPSLVKHWLASGCLAGLDWSAIHVFSSTGEPSSPADYLALMARAGWRPVIEYCGGTEIGGGFVSGTVVQPAAPSAFSTPTPGLSFVLLDEEGRETENGEIFLVPPSIGLSTTLLNKDHHEVYHAGAPRGPRGELLRRHGDQFEHLGGGFYRTLGRSDDAMNLGGIKVASAEIERVLATLPGIRETAAIAVPPPGGGPSLLLICAVLEAGADADPEALKAACQRRIAEHLNPLFRVHKVAVLDALPRTASNKVMRRVLRDRLG